MPDTFLFPDDAPELTIADGLVLVRFTNEGHVFSEILQLKDGKVETAYGLDFLFPAEDLRTPDDSALDSFLRHNKGASLLQYLENTVFSQDMDDVHLAQLKPGVILYQPDLIHVYHYEVEEDEKVA